MVIWANNMRCLSRWSPTRGRKRTCAADFDLAATQGEQARLLPTADPYLNMDAGTMSPFEHGEVFVLDDGGEVRCHLHGPPSC